MGAVRLLGDEEWGRGRGKGLGNCNRLILELVSERVFGDNKQT